jgi:thioredoxin-like negative regulator of GroEL
MNATLDVADAIGTLTHSTFTRTVEESAGPVAVEFMSYGCGHCAALEPVLQEAAALLESEIVCYRVNVAVDQALASEFRITGTPTIVLFAHGAVAGRIEGPKPQLTALLAAIRRPFGSQRD